MANRWAKSGLVYGEQLRIPSDMFITGRLAKKRLRSVNYLGETSQGILIGCYFEPGIRTMSPEFWNYKIMINWASIYCGNVKIHRADGTSVQAQLVS